MRSISPSLTFRTGTRHSTTDVLPALPDQFFLSCWPYKTIWPKKSGAVLIHAHPCHFCLFQHCAFAPGPLWQVYYCPCLCPKQMPAGEASVPAGQLLAKTVVQDLNLWVSSTVLWGKPALLSVYPLTKHWQTQRGHTILLQGQVN